MKYQVLRGTKDILPDETPVWQQIEEKIGRIFKRYGFSEIRTPIIEQSELFSRSIGDSSDIVTKEMYTFKDKGDRSVTLRPEATASVVRAAVENNLLTKDRITKLYYIGPMFRYERPQAGRFRQFNQAGVELFGTSSYLADIEVIMAGIDLFDSLGLKSLEVDINS
ncbi:MAG: ATP phosphoribosyltransferase regulatory subunit, partial [Candidatus Saganbacteria bacterium]|nr:ATP phosphoribosyltransferase regulatory subunit [Candidatus Saganbacteria bacterium]